MEANFEELLRDSNLVGHYINEEIKSLEINQLTWKPTPEQWSLVEVVDHLNLIYDKYLTHMKLAIDQAPTLVNNRSQKKKTTILGNLSVYSMKPKKQVVRFKMKTFDFFDPRQDPKTVKDIFETFARNKGAFNELIKTARLKDVESVKIPTSLGSRIRFYIIQCMEFIIAHEQRHLIQMKALQDAVLDKHVISA